MAVNDSLIHILVIWSKANDKKGIIMEDLRKDFEILKIFKVHWDKDLFIQNYMTFYAHSQYHLAPDAYQALLMGKIEHCGDEDFTVVILRDTHPLFETRLTSSGKRLVNTHIFDKKTRYRALTGGGHKIHSSDDAWETNHDLTLLFGLNTEDFRKKYVLDGAEATLTQNCVGIGGYKSIEQFFYVLNNCIRYVIMRNHECLPNLYTVEGHGDIDLLCDNMNWMAYLTNAKPVFTEPYRVFHTILIGGNEVPFDFRFVGDNYYDQPWQENILSTRILVKNLFYAPNAENQYYSLLYHTYIQKWEIKEDYLPKLKMYAEQIGIVFSSNVKTSILQLDSFLSKHRFEYVRPRDITVIYNADHISQSDYAHRYGQLLKRLDATISGALHYHSRVYEKSNSFVKIGTPWLIENEANYLRRLSDMHGVPKLLGQNKDTKHNENIIEISRMPGVDFKTFFDNTNHQRAKYVRSFIICCIRVLMSLSDNRVAHRDFLPSNLIISEENGKLQVSLIDFGWASEISCASENRPDNLAGRFVSNDNFTDAHSFGMFLLDYWYDLPYIRLISWMLRNITNKDTKSAAILTNKYNSIILTAKIMFSPYDSWRLLCRRHLRIGWTKQLILNKLKKIANYANTYYL